MIRFNSCLLLSFIVLFCGYNFYYNSEYYKKLYHETVAPKVWGIEIVEEKNTFEDISWDLVDLMIGFLPYFISFMTGFVVSFAIGWIFIYYRSVYGKEITYLDECLRKQGVLERKVDLLKEKLQEFEKTYSVELIYKRNSEEMFLPLIKNAYQQMTSEAVDRSSQTSSPESKATLVATEGIDVNSIVDDMEDQCPIIITGDPWNLKSEKQQDSLNTQIDSEDFCDNQHLEEEEDQEGNVIEVKEEHSNDLAVECDIDNISSYVNEQCPIEIDVQCESASNSKEIHDDEPERNVLPIDLKQGLTIEDIMPGTPGAGECEEIPSKVKICRRIPQYQGLRKGSDQKNKGYREQDTIEDIPPLIVNQTPELISELGKPMRISSPRKYSVSADTVDHTVHGGRRRKQKNYLPK